MKIIFSRKGFDSSSGGVPSPILSDGTMLSLPIPEKRCPIKYDNIRHPRVDVGQVVADLTRKRITGRHGAHIDPDLDAWTFRRKKGWRPLFGPSGVNLTMFDRLRVGPGDVFLFFGWFRRADFGGGRYRYVRGSENVHVLFGWFQVGSVLGGDEAAIPGWALDHPHYAGSRLKNKEIVYAASERLAIHGRGVGVPGAGTFAEFHPDLQLTAPGEKRSIWRLPRWFHPGKRTPLGYHSDLKRWRRHGDFVRLRSVGRGQEFVLDAHEYPEAVEWVSTLVRERSR